MFGFLARLARFERTTFRLGVWVVQYPVLPHGVMQCRKTPKNKGIWAFHVSSDFPL